MIVFIAVKKKSLSNASIYENLCVRKETFEENFVENVGWRVCEHPESYVSRNLIESLVVWSKAMLYFSLNDWRTFWTSAVKMPRGEHLSIALRCFEYLRKVTLRNLCWWYETHYCILHNIARFRDKRGIWYDAMAI